MSADRRTYTYDVTNPRLVAADLRAALNELPDDVRVALAPTVGLVLAQRLVAIDGAVAQPSPLFVAFAEFIDRLVDELQATRQ